MSGAVGVLMGFLVPSWQVGTLYENPSEVFIPGLRGSVNVYRDAKSALYIDAEYELDMWKVLGYVHAQDRLFQVMGFKMASAGRIAEMIGMDGVPLDKFLRVFGLRRVAEKDYEKMRTNTDPQAKRVLEVMEAYCAGFNCWLHHPDFQKPTEAFLLGLKIEDYEPVDILCFSRFLGLQMSKAWQLKLRLSELVSMLPKEFHSQLKFLYGIDSSMIQTPHVNFDCDFYKKMSFAKLSKEFSASCDFSGSFDGSNAVAITGRFTNSGDPLFFADPHLPMDTPNLMYPISMKAKDTNYAFAGVMVPGFVGEVIGHNEFVVWSITLNFNNVGDFYLEKFNAARQYEFEGEWYDPIIHQEPIKVKARDEPIKYEVYETKSGCVLETLETQEETGFQYRLSVKIVCTSTPHTLTAIVRLGCPKENGSVEQFTNRVKQLHHVALNLVCADTHGNIGHAQSGRTPFVDKEDYTDMYSPGWIQKGHWKGLLRPEQAVGSINPECGYNISCNQFSVEESCDFAYVYGSAHTSNYRSNRIREQLEERTSDGELLTLKDMMDIQCDTRSNWGVDILPLLQARFDEYGIPLPESLEDWDGTTEGEDSVAFSYILLLCMHTVRLMYRNIVETKLNYETEEEKVHLVEMFLGKSTWEPLSKIGTLSYRVITIFKRMLEQPDSWWCEESGGLDNLLTEGFQRTRESLRKLTNSNDESDWQYTKFSKCTHAHKLGKKFPSLFDRGGYSRGSCQSAVNKYHLMYHCTPVEENITGRNVASVPQFRMACEVAKGWSHFYLTMFGGANENLMSKFNECCTEDYKNCVYVRREWDFSKLEDIAVESFVVTNGEPVAVRKKGYSWTTWLIIISVGVCAYAYSMRD